MEGVRLVHLDRDELAEVDVHPLVRADMDVTMLLAELFMAKSGVEGPLCECQSPARNQSYLCYVSITIPHPTTAQIIPSSTQGRGFTPYALYTCSPCAIEVLRPSSYMCPYSLCRCSP